MWSTSRGGQAGCGVCKVLSWTGKNATRSLVVLALANLVPGSQELGMSASAAGARDAFAVAARTSRASFDEFVSQLP